MKATLDKSLTEKPFAQAENADDSIDGRVDTEDHLRGIDTQQQDDEILSDKDQQKSKKNNTDDDFCEDED